MDSGCRKSRCDRLHFRTGCCKDIFAMLSASRKAEPSSPDDGRRRPPEWSRLHRECVLAAQRLGSGPYDAEDLAQEAMARLLAAQPAVERPRAWLRTVVVA